MRRFALLAAAALGLIAAHARPAAANAADREYIQRKLVIQYLPNPNDVKSVVAVNPIQVGSTATFTPEPTLTSFRDMIQSLYSDKPAGGLTVEDQDRLQTVVAATLRITDKPIRVVLVNDLNAPITNAASQAEFNLSCTDHWQANPPPTPPTLLAAQRVWPTAMVVGSNPTPETARPYGGSFSMGAYRITKDTNNFPSFMKVMMVFAHELTHTQDLSYMRWIEYRVFHYGKDGSHFFEEAVPSLASAYKEGLANFVGWWFARPYLSHVAAWHGTDGYVLVEKAPADATSADPSDLFIYNLLDPAKKQPVVFGDKNINDNYGVWKISGMPPRLLVHNEQIIALVLFYRAMATSTGFAEVMDSFKKSNAGNFRVSSSAWARLIDQLSTQLLPSTITRNNVANVSPGRALLLMALCDYFTGFRAKDQAELMAMFENQAFVKDWVVAYDTSAKASVRDAVRKWETANAAPPGNQSDRWRERLTGVTGVIAATVGIR